MPSIRSTHIGGGERPDIRRFEHLLKLANVVDNAFNVHFDHSITNQAKNILVAPIILENHRAGREQQ